MTSASAQAVIDRMEVDEDFANRVKDAGGPEASIAILGSEGFDVTPSDMRDAFLDRFGDQLTEEQLETIAGGTETGELVAGIAVFIGGIALCAAASAV
jgi:predicted ribosomally synthesized peptide with nif11-like leader